MRIATLRAQAEDRSFGVAGRPQRDAIYHGYMLALEEVLRESPSRP